MKFFFSKRVVEILKKWAPPRQVTFDVAHVCTIFLSGVTEFWPPPLEQYSKPVLVTRLYLTIDDYAKDGGPAVILLLCSFYREPFRSLIVKEVQ